MLPSEFVDERAKVVDDDDAKFSSRSKSCASGAQEILDERTSDSGGYVAENPVERFLPRRKISKSQAPASFNPGETIFVSVQSTPFRGQQVPIDHHDLRRRKPRCNRKAQRAVTAAHVENSLGLASGEVIEQKERSFVDLLGREDIVGNTKLEACAKCV